MICNNYNYNYNYDNYNYDNYNYDNYNYDNYNFFLALLQVNVTFRSQNTDIQQEQKKVH